MINQRKILLIILISFCFAWCGCESLREQQIPSEFQQSADPGKDTQKPAVKKSPPREIAEDKKKSLEPGDIAAAQGRKQFAAVDLIVDGDTIRLTTGEKVRYIGVDTPEIAHNGNPPEYYGSEATECNRRLLGDGPIKLVFDRGRKDKYGRLLAYVYSGPDFTTFVNAELLRQGCARVMRIPPNTRHADEFRDIEAAAKKRQAGLWAD